MRKRYQYHECIDESKSGVGEDGYCVLLLETGFVSWLLFHIFLIHKYVKYGNHSDISSFISNNKTVFPLWNDVFIGSN